MVWRSGGSLQREINPRDELRASSSDVSFVAA